jgi:ABC-type dipeptide/oligopeptide/nickel transport system ATPase component
MNAEKVKLTASLFRKTKRELVDMYLFQISNYRRNRESLMMIRYDLNKVMIMADSTIALPNSEKQEILNHLQEVEKILKFNVNELDNESEAQDV